MSQPITLNLPENTIRLAQEIARQTGRSFETILAEWVERGSTQDDVMKALLTTQHHLYSPLGGEETAQALFEFLKSEKSKR